MKIAIHYFSGCGNTAWVVKKAKEELSAQGNEIVLIQNIEQAWPTVMPASDLDLFLSPTYFFGLPVNMISYFKRLPMVANRPCLFWSVNGGASGASFFMARMLLKDKGYVVTRQASIEMPDTFLFLTQSQMTKDQRRQVLDNAIVQVKSAANDVANLQPESKESLFKLAFFGVVFLMFYAVFRFTTGLSMVANSRCVHCGKCAENCPSHAIAFGADKKPHWRMGCSGCFRCLNNCPAKAIDFSMWAVVFGLVGAIGGLSIIGSVFGFLGIISKVIGLFAGWLAGCYVFQCVSSMFNADKMLMLVDKKRVTFSSDENA